MKDPQQPVSPPYDLWQSQAPKGEQDTELFEFNKRKALEWAARNKP